MNVLQHEAIQEFPSQTFYNGKLQIGKDSQRAPSKLEDFWSSGSGKPIMFIDVVGEEMSLAVRTGYGSEQSKWNLDEIKQTVYISLVNMKT